MATEHAIQGDPSDIRRASPVALLLLTERMVRQARTARAAAIGNTVARGFAAAARGVRLLSLAACDAFALRDTLMPARRRGRTHHLNHHQ
ncbi:hypothetical protein ABIE49_004937 [Bradyrhizobium sp. OAE829]